MSLRSLLSLLLALLILSPGNAWGGMPSFELTEVVRLRLEVISFFIATMLAVALLTRWAWNVLAKDFAWLPSIGYRQAVALVSVSGLFFYVVLTMISGARELMTPGAWAKQGSTYKLATPEQDARPWLAAARRQALERVRDALWSYAREHQGQLPPNRVTGDISDALWSGAHPQSEPFGYLPGRQPGVGSRLVVFEHDGYGTQRFVLLSDGQVESLSAQALTARIIKETQEDTAHER